MVRLLPRLPAVASPGSLGQRGQPFLDPLPRDPRQCREFAASLGLGLRHAADHRRRFAVLGLARKFETDAVRVVEIDAEQPRKLRDWPDIIDAAALQPRLDFAEPCRRDDKGAMLHPADGVAVARRLLAFRDLE